MAMFASSSGFWDQPLVVWYSLGREDWVAWRRWRDETWYFHRGGEWAHTAGANAGFPSRAELVMEVDKTEKETRSDG